MATERSRCSNDCFPIMRTGSTDPQRPVAPPKCWRQSDIAERFLANTRFEVSAAAVPSLAAVRIANYNDYRMPRQGTDCQRTDHRVHIMGGSPHDHRGQRRRHR
jgi:hypothetical protein